MTAPVASSSSSVGDGQAAGGGRDAADVDEILDCQPGAAPAPFPSSRVMQVVMAPNVTRLPREAPGASAAAVLASASAAGGDDRGQPQDLLGTRQVGRRHEHRGHAAPGQQAVAAGVVARRARVVQVLPAYVAAATRQICRTKPSRARPRGSAPPPRPTCQSLTRRSARLRPDRGCGVRRQERRPPDQPGRRRILAHHGGDLSAIIADRLPRS